MAESEQIEIASILEKHKIPLIIGLLGLVLIIGGGFLIAISRQSEDKIEIIPAGSETTTATSQKIKADIEGAVIKPGVYELETGSRVNDLLILAGGLSATADREWVQATLNLAQKLTDGAKIYIPEVSKGEESTKSIKGMSTTGSTSITSITSITGLININTASATELDTLYGVGPATAQKIINNRPYQSIDELLSKKVVNKNVFDTMKDKISIY